MPSVAPDPCGIGKGLSRLYSAQELGAMPLGAQIMGSHLAVMQELVPRLLDSGAPRIDLNCGCPANQVTGKGAGSRCEP